MCPAWPRCMGNVVVDGVLVAGGEQRYAGGDAVKRIYSRLLCGKDTGPLQPETLQPPHIQQLRDG